MFGMGVLFLIGGLVGLGCAGSGQAQTQQLPEWSPTSIPDVVMEEAVMFPAAVG